jgi:amino acid transporter
MTKATDPVPEDPPLVVSANADRMSAVARLVLGAGVVLALAGAVALPTHDLVVGTTIPRPRGEYTAAAIVGGLAAFVAGVFWWAACPVSWTIDAGGITQDGPGDCRRDLRWAEVRRVQRGQHAYEFIGQPGLNNIRLPREAIPKDRRASVLAGVEVILREHFQFPPTPTGGIGWALAWVAALFAVAYGPPYLYLLVFLKPFDKSRLPTITGWVWVRRLVAWNVDAASALVPLILLAPALAYIGIVAWLIGRRVTRDTQIVPKRPGAPTEA